jgi:hypothetical protein
VRDRATAAAHRHRLPGQPDRHLVTLGQAARTAQRAQRPRAPPLLSRTGRGAPAAPASCQPNAARSRPLRCVLTMWMPPPRRSSCMNATSTS